MDTQQMAQVLARAITDKAASENHTNKLVPGTVLNTMTMAGRPWTYANVHIAGDPPDRVLQAPILTGLSLRPGDPVMVMFDPPEGAYVVSGPGPMARPRIKLYRTTDQLGIPTGTIGGVIFDANSAAAWEHPNRHTFHDPAGANPSRVTVPPGFGGLVQFHWGIAYAHSSGGDCRASLYRNGNFLADSTYSWPTGSGQTTTTGAGMFEVTDDEFYELVHLQNTGNPTDLKAGEGRTFLSLVWGP